MTYLSINKLEYRPDIDGLRAVAVSLVILFHAFPEFISGGFIGVDVFFVISGYLISGIIFYDLSDNKINLFDFYVRRVNRIFPALLIILVVSFIIGWFVLLGEEFSMLSEHIMAGLMFASNIIYWGESGYFDGSPETKPLLHLWSLGVEEQFYIFWPLLLWLVWRNNINFFKFMVLMGGLSFGLSVAGVRYDAIAAFYLPQTRFWELLCGGTLAWVIIYRKNLWKEVFPRISIFIEDSALLKSKNRQEVFYNTISIFGMLFLICGGLLIDKNMHFPGELALIPVFSAILIIWAGSNSWINRVFLSNRLMINMGLISFPLYLWHWPLLSFARIIYGETPSIGIRFGLIVAAIVLAWFTYYYIERPIRFFGDKSIKAGIFIFLATALGLGNFYIYKYNILSNGAQKQALLSKQVGWSIPPSSKEQTVSCHAMFPERDQLTPKERDDNFCIIKSTARPNVVMVGDSLNLSLFPGLAKYADIQPLVLSASSAAPFYNIRTTEFNDKTRLLNYKLTNHALDYVISHDYIKVVIMSFLNGPLLTNPINSFKIIDISNPENQDAEHIFKTALSSTLKKLLAKGKSVIYILPNPSLSFDIKSCLVNYRLTTLGASMERQCAQPTESHLARGGRLYRKWVDDVLKNFPEVIVFDAAGPLCDTHDCWGVKNNKVLYRDNVHLSIDGSDYIAPFLVEKVRGALKFNSPKVLNISFPQSESR